jgi:predicted amidophosphoribosyltransferase
MTTIDQALQQAESAAFAAAFETGEERKYCSICKDETDNEDGICCDLCRSQAMYQNARQFEKEALDKVLAACRVISDYGEVARKLVNDNLNGYVSDELETQANEFLKAVNEADWTNKPSREERLERAATDAERRISRLGRHLGIEVQCAIDGGYLQKCYEWREGIKAANAASCIHIAQDLKAALND